MHEGSTGSTRTCSSRNTFALAVGPGDQRPRHFSGRLAVETDPSDVRVDLKRGKAGFVVVDVRGPEAFAERRVPGAINLPYRLIDEAAAAPSAEEQDGSRGARVRTRWASLPCLSQ